MSDKSDERGEGGEGARSPAHTISKQVQGASMTRPPQMSAPPRRVPSLYPTSPPASKPVIAAPGAPNDRAVAHSLRPRSSPMTIETLRERRHSEALAREGIVEQTLYDLFEVPPTVSEDELRRAYKRVWACFHPDHYSSYGLYSRAQLEAQLDLFQNAFELLMDSERRQAYNIETFPDGVPQPKPVTRREAESRLTPTFQTLIPKREARARWSSSVAPERLGAALKNLREHFNLPLSLLHERSKISVSMLELIEADDFKSMPAEVYLRGFIKELLQLYGVIALVDLESYFKAYRAARA